LLLGCGRGKQTTASVAGRYTREGYQDEYLLLNRDGTYTKRVRVLTDEPETSSGTWKLENNTMQEYNSDYGTCTYEVDGTNIKVKVDFGWSEGKIEGDTIVGISLMDPDKTWVKEGG
jgi:hypothetical protein